MPYFTVLHYISELYAMAQSLLSQASVIQHNVMQTMLHDSTVIHQLKYLAVYGHASMGNYYGCAFRVLAVFRQLSTHGQKFDPEYEPI